MSKRGWILFIALGVLWGMPYLLIRIAVGSFDPLIVAGVRTLLAALLLVPVALHRDALMPAFRHWKWLLAFTLIEISIPWLLLGHAETRLNSSTAGLLIAVVPLMIAALNLLWRIYPSRLELAGIGVGLAGVLMLTQGAGFQASSVGLAAITIACLTWSLGSVLSQRSLPLAAGAMGFASEMICGGVLLLALSAASGEGATVAAHWPPAPAAVAAWVYLVVFGSLIAFNAYMLLLSRASAALASSYTFVNPVIAMMLGVAIAGEHITGYEWTAAAIVLCGVVLMLRGRSG